MKLMMSAARRVDPETVSVQSSVSQPRNQPALLSPQVRAKPNPTLLSPGLPNRSQSFAIQRQADKDDPSSEVTTYKVFVRIRPFLTSECDPADGSFPLPPIETKGVNEISFIDLSSGLPRDKFLFDGCFCSITPEQWQQMADLIGMPKESLFDVPPCATQSDIYQSCGQPYVDAVMDGYNASILAYGQTSSGKTFTMMGTPQQEGLIPRMAKAIIAEAARRTVTGGASSPSANSPGGVSSTASSPRSEQGLIWREFSLEVSFFEIYNEAVLDLLEPPSSSAKSVGHRKRKVRTHPVFGVYVEGLQYEKITTWAQCLKLLHRGLQLRHTAATKMNEASSRSHAIFQLRIIQSEMTDIGPTQRRSNVYLADLAGSERLKLSNAEGERLKEAAQINLSLTTLRRVIDALIQQSKTSTTAFSSVSSLGNGSLGSAPPSAPRMMVPYRDSILTWILSESLGGNAKAIMIATLCPHPAYAEETFNTLVYASRAKSIVNTVVRNEDQMAKMIRQLADALKQANNSSDSLPGASAASAEQAEELRNSQALVEQLRGEQVELMRTVAATKSRLAAAEERIGAVEDERNKTAAHLKAASTKHATVVGEYEALRKRLQAVEVEKRILEDRAASHSTEKLAWEAQRREWEQERTDLERELQILRDERSLLQDDKAQLQSKVALLHTTLEEHKSSSAQTVHRTMASFMPLLRWYQSVLNLVGDTLLSSRRSALVSQIGTWSCAWAVSAQALLTSQITSARRLEGTLKDLEVVNVSQDKALTQVAQTYMNVREFLFKSEKGVIERQWTVGGILQAFSEFCRNAEAVPAVSLRSAVAMRAYNSRAEATSDATPQRPSQGNRSSSRRSPSAAHSGRSASASRKSVDRKPFS